MKLTGGNQLQSSVLEATNNMVIGYYPLRGRAQICRLLCEYLHLPYKDLLFTPKTWDEFKNSQQIQDWTFEELPFLKDGETIVTEIYPICLYLIHKANRKDLLGSTLMEQIKLDSLIWQTDPAAYITTHYINHRDLTPEVKNDAIGKLWSRAMTPKLTKMEEQASNKFGFYFEHLTLVDFYIYETFYFLKIVCSERLGPFPKLMQIANNFYNILEIKQYETAKRSIKEVCPVKFCVNWRQRCRQNAQKA